MSVRRSGSNALDTLVTFETPEGVELNMNVAGPIPRALAWLIDAAIRYSILMAIAFVSFWLSNFGQGVLVLALFLLEWLYPVIFEARNGTTPGKKRMGLMVIHVDGTPLSWSSALIRNLLRAVDFLPTFYLLGLISMVVNKRFQRLGDLAAATLVVYAPAPKQQRQIPQAAGLLPPLALSLQEEQAILDFAERSSMLTPSRQEELARHLLAGMDLAADTAQQRILRYANALSRS